MSKNRFNHIEVYIKHNIILEYIYLEIIPLKGLFMADFHARAIEIYQKCLKNAQLQDTILIAAGDMGVSWERGSDSNPLLFVTKMLPKVRALYYVAGNHDIVTDELRMLKNRDGTPVLLQADVVDIDSCALAGLSGIISSKKKNQRFNREEYFELLDGLFDQNILHLVTHETPQIPSISNSYKGQVELTQRVIDSTIETHFFAHCRFHPNWIGEQEGVTFVNVADLLVSVNRERNI
ncbi:MAG: hypothetical protein ACFE9L_19125 [Candidatus Hodarchaeota archaeon]